MYCSKLYGGSLGGNQESFLSDVNDLWSVDNPQVMFSLYCSKLYGGSLGGNQESFLSDVNDLWSVDNPQVIFLCIVASYMEEV